jgi:hypothetical protein
MVRIPFTIISPLILKSFKAAVVVVILKLAPEFMVRFLVSAPATLIIG